MSSQAQLRAMMQKHAENAPSTGHRTKLTAVQLRQIKKQKHSQAHTARKTDQHTKESANLSLYDRSRQNPAGGVSHSVPAGFYDDSASKDHAKPSAVPAGFFDNDKLDTNTSLKATPVVASAEASNTTTAARTAAPMPGAANIPAGFFDDTAVDDKVRAVNVKAKRRVEEADEWAQFTAFTADIEAEEAAREQREQSSYQQRDERADVESDLWRMRVADIKARTLAKRGEKRRRDPPSPSPSPPAVKPDARAVGSAEDDQPDEGWSLLTVAPALPAAIDSQRAAKVFAAGTAGTGAKTAATTAPTAATTTATNGDSDDDEDYMLALGLDWRSKGS